MADSKMDDQSLTCSICLEHFKYPVTIPCGHTFCKDCISMYWEKKMEEKKEKEGRFIFNCPVCNHAFVERPPLNRNVSLSVLTEAVADSLAIRDVATYGADTGHNDAKQLCPKHLEPLIFYCRTDGMCVCKVCSVKECKEHDMVMVEEERKNKEEGLMKKSMDIRKHKQEREQNIRDLTENISETKVVLQQTSQWVNAKFSQLLKVLMEKQEVTRSFMEQQQASIVSQAEARLDDLREKVQQLKELEEQISRLCALPHIQFIQDSRLVKVPQMGVIPVDVSVNVQDKLAPVTDVLSRITKLVCDDLDKAVYVAVIHNKEASPQDKRPTLAVVPSPAMACCPAENEGLYQYLRSLTFDRCTANAHLMISQDNRRAEHLTSGPHTVPVHDARFDHTWQVLCCEKFLHGCHYWELEVSKAWAYVGVTYPGIQRKEKGKVCMLGMNELSWSLQLNERQFTAWHGGKSECLAASPRAHNQPLRIGILLNYEEGTLEFYGENQVRLHTFHNVFLHELYPACWIGEGVSVTLTSP